MSIPSQDRLILRDLGRRIAEIAALPVHQQATAGWTRINKLQSHRPMISIFQIPWGEMNVNDELTLRTEDPWSRSLENGMRQLLYQWEHIRDDRVVEATVWSGPAVSDTGFGISEQSDVTTESGIASRRFHEQIQTLDDVAKIKLPVVTYDEVATERQFERLSELFNGLRPVRRGGFSHYWFAPWDLLITWYGVEHAMLDMVLKPDLVNALISRLVDAYLYRLQQWEDFNLLSLPPANGNTGSGGLGCTDELPQPDYDPAHVRPPDLWGCATPQIFSEVSPEMHWEFALRHEMRWLEKWGLTYYGCCEPLHHKVPMLRRIPNLRKISISPKADKTIAAQNIGRDFVVSLKPNPAIFAIPEWDPEIARQELRADLEPLRGCVVEIVMKDISTVRGEPQRLWDWARVAREVAEEFA